MQMKETKGLDNLSVATQPANGKPGSGIRQFSAGSNFPLLVAMGTKDINREQVS